MKLNLTILSLVLSLVVTSSHATVLLVDEYKFNSNLASEKGNANLRPLGGGATTVNYSDNAVVIHSMATPPADGSSSGGGGVFAIGNSYNLTDNWAVQIDLKFLNTTGTGAKIFTSNNSGSGTANGVSLMATNIYGGSAQSFALCTGGSSWGGMTAVTTGHLQSGTNMSKLSLVNKGGNLYLFFGSEQLSFGVGKDFLTLSDLGLSSAVLNDFMLGFGSNATGGISPSNDLTVDNLSIYSFGADDSLDAVRAKMGIGATVPEPTAASLALLGLAACGLRRHRSR